MLTNKNFYLLAGIIILLVDLTGPGHRFGAGVLKPIGAVALVMYFIFLFLGKESEKFDQEQHPKGGGH